VQVDFGDTLAHERLEFAKKMLVTRSSWAKSAVMQAEAVVCFAACVRSTHPRSLPAAQSIYKQPDEEIAFHLEKRIVGLLRR
jgi:hypothetical protein